MLALVFIIIGVIFYDEMIYRLEFKLLFRWFVEHPLSFLLNILIHLGVFGLLHQFLPAFIAISLTVILSIALAYGNKYKSMFRGDHLFPWDLKLGKESSEMGDFLDKRFIALDILLAAVAVAISSIVMMNVSLTRNLSLMMAGVSLVGMSLRWMKHREIPVIDQIQFNADNGVILAFVLNVREMMTFFGRSIQNPRVDEKPRSPLGSVQDDKIRPHVVIVMSESFWDPAEMEGVSFDRPLTPNLNRLREKGIYGKLISPEFGGGTSNIEFELMTGNNMFFLPTGTMAYNSFVNKDIDAIPGMLKKQGYSTIGMHPYIRWFWNRVPSYEHMGFDAYISEESFEDPVRKGAFVSDQSFMEKIIEIVECDDKPSFVFAASMQNHGPYSVDRYDEFDFHIEAPLDGTERGELKCYAQGIVDADQALGDLILHFERKKEPAIVLFFGDHMPMLGKKFSIFQKCGYISHNNPTMWTDLEKMKMASTPFIIWSTEDLEPKDLGLASPAKIGLELLDLLPVKKTEYFHWLEQFYQEHPVLNKRIHETSFVSDISQDSLDEYAGKQREMLFGNKTRKTYTNETA